MTADHIAPAEPEPEPPAQRCEHCGHLPDTLIVVKRVTTYERHAPDCPVINRKD
jgi:hypothetical protein